MTIKEREQTVKDLQEIVDNYSGSWQRFNVLDNALALIKELAEERDALEQHNGYLKGLVDNAFCEKLKHFDDPSAARACAEAEMWRRIALREKELVEENERLRVALKEYFKNAWTIESDIIHKMQSMIKEECIAGGIYPAFVARVVENVGKKLLEDKNDV